MNSSTPDEHVGNESHSHAQPDSTAPTDKGHVEHSAHTETHESSVDRLNRPLSSRWFKTELVVVFAVSLGASAVYSILRIIKLSLQGPISAGTASLNNQRAKQPYLDLAYQLVDNLLPLAPVALALLLLGLTWAKPWRRLGLDWRAPRKDLLWGCGLAALIGIPGIGVYVLGRLAGITAKITPAALADYWWTIPILVLAALKNGLLEEVLVVGYLADRLDRLGIPQWWAATISSVLRGSYHLYQGVGPFFGNVAMGYIFWFAYRKTGRVMPLVIAHTILDVVAFVGWALIGDRLTLP